MPKEWSPQRSVLCRTCANWRGRDTGSERRSGVRTCSAGIATCWDVTECESYVRRFGPAAGLAPAREIRKA